MNKLSEIRCIHRHTIEEHPSCFKNNLVKNKSEKKTWYEQQNLKIAYIDIETDGLEADFSTMLTWCIKPLDGITTFSLITREELFNLEFDKRLVRDCIYELKKYDIVVGYYSKRFDLPYIRTKALRYGIDFPMYDELYHWDIYDTVRHKLRLSRNSLDNACDYLGIKGKTPIDKDVWRLAKYGSESALLTVLAHNKADVEITEQLHKKLGFTRRWNKSLI